MIRKITILSAFFAGSLAISTASATDLGEIQAGEEYTYAALEPVTATFTVPSDGHMKTYFYTGDMIYAYADQAHTQMIPSESFYYGPNGSKVLTYNLAGIETIYFYNNLPLDGGTMKLVWGDEPVLIDAMHPNADAEGNVSLSSNYTLDLVFNMPVDFTKCTLEAGGESQQVYPTVYDTTITLNWFNILMNWYREGVITEGSDLKVSFTGIRDKNNAANRYGEKGGRLELNYKMAAKPAEVTSMHNTPTSGMRDFLSYYLPGSGDGIVSLTFDRELDPNCLPTVVIQYGDLDQVDFEMYYENPPVYIEGNTVKVDLEGKSRLANEMVPGLPQQQYIGLRITGIKSADGQYVWTGQSSSPYSFGFSYNFREVVYTIAADWYPVIGRQLNPGDEMEIWVMNGNKIMFDTVDFAYVKEGENAIAQVPFEEVTSEADPYEANAVSYFLTVPEMTPDADTEIIVTLGGLLCGDGQDHNSDIVGKFKAGTSGVDEIESMPTDGAVYDLQGRRVSGTLAPGVYVRDGKKIMITL